MEIKIDLDAWVQDAPNEQEAEFRKAVHILLYTLALSDERKCQYALKGGILLAIRYDSPRFTTDVDLSTSEAFTQDRADLFLDQIGSQLPHSVASLGYGIDCRVQSHEVRPKPGGEDKQFFTLQIKIGYAVQGTRQHRRLLDGKTSKTFQVDYSFFEKMPNLEGLTIDEGMVLPAYTIHDLVAEKLRTMLQQAVRNRYRRQDAFDIYKLLNQGVLESKDDRKRVLESLLEKSASRSLEVSQTSLDAPDIRDRSRREYENLRAEVVGTIPEFDAVYDRVVEFYRTLPWPA